MKITNIKVDLFRFKNRPWQVGARPPHSGAHALGVVTVETDEGVEGHAFLGSSNKGGDFHVKDLIAFIKPMILGQDAQDIGKIWQMMWKKNREVAIQAIAAVDIALWDINGKIASLPIHRLLGTVRESVPAYSSSPWHASVEEYVEEALHFKEIGWTAHKVHPHGQPRKDVEICTALREAVGPDFTLMLDAMWMYGYEDALRVGRAIEKLGYYWYEDPLVEEDIYNYVKLLPKLDIPVISTEFVPGRFYGTATWITQYATDMLRGDAVVTGGITPLVKLCHMAEGFNMKCEIHHGHNSLGNAANLHVMMSVPNCEFYEVFPSGGELKYGLVEDIEVDENGLVHAPTEPGLGFAIDWDLVKRDHVGTVE